MLGVICFALSGGEHVIDGDGRLVFLLDVKRGDVGLWLDGKLFLLGEKSGLQIGIGTDGNPFLRAAFVIKRVEPHLPGFGEGRELFLGEGAPGLGSTRIADVKFLGGHEGIGWAGEGGAARVLSVCGFRLTNFCCFHMRWSVRRPRRCSPVSSTRSVGAKPASLRASASSASVAGGVAPAVAVRSPGSRPALRKIEWMRVTA